MKSFVAGLVLFWGMSMQCMACNSQAVQQVCGYAVQQQVQYVAPVYAPPLQLQAQVNYVAPQPIVFPQVQYAAAYVQPVQAVQAVNYGYGGVSANVVLGARSAAVVQPRVKLGIRGRRDLRIQARAAINAPGAQALIVAP